MRPCLVQKSSGLLLFTQISAPRTTDCSPCGSTSHSAPVYSNWFFYFKYKAFKEYFTFTTAAFKKISFKVRVRTFADHVLIACVSCTSLLCVQRQRRKSSDECKQTKKRAVNISFAHWCSVVRTQLVIAYEVQFVQLRGSTEKSLSTQLAAQLDPLVFSSSAPHFYGTKGKKKKNINKDSVRLLSLSYSRGDVFDPSTFKSHPGRGRWLLISCYGNKSRNMSPSSGQGRRQLPLLGQRSCLACDVWQRTQRASLRRLPTDLSCTGKLSYYNPQPTSGTSRLSNGKNEFPHWPHPTHPPPH